MGDPRGDVTIREFTPDDLADFVHLAADARVTRHVGDGSPWDSARALERARAAFRDENCWYSIVVDAQRWAGIVVLEPTDSGQTEFGIWLHPDHWGGGVARRAATSALDVFSREQPDASVIAHVAPGNVASRALMAAIGLTHRTDVISRYGTPVGRFELQAGL